MKTCPECGAEITDGAEYKYRLCRACMKQVLEQTWKRQMRVYGIAMFVGLVVLVFVYSRFTAGGFEFGEAPLYLLVLLALAGLGLMGGLFGFGLALFFSMWHKKKD